GAEEAFKKAVKLQEVLAKQRANKLGLKLSDERAKKLVEERFGNLFSGKPSNFERFANASDEAKQAFTDYDLKQAAA
ncbi:MAG: hypothetical protein QG623_487, partial [Patescibacteria group bacterium]|nr:hypothetical protein [Patescibacteria group bacterium]